MANPTLLIAAASRPYPGEVVNGDAWAVAWHGPGCRVALVDGLGHGPEAATAARAALAALAAQPALAPVEALAVCHRALAGTRGAAISVVHIDPDADRLSFAGVGNVEVQLWQAGRARRLLPWRGIVGVARPRPRPEYLALAGDWLLLLHTDGVSSHLALEEVLPVAAPGLQAVADAVLARWGRATDDATVVVISRAP
jgi:serine phosphatase RsbU (regulator of sigma subunit)